MIISNSCCDIYFDVKILQVTSYDAYKIPFPSGRPTSTNCPTSRAVVYEKIVNLPHHLIGGAYIVPTGDYPTGNPYDTIISTV